MRFVPTICARWLAVTGVVAVATIPLLAQRGGEERVPIRFRTGSEKVPAQKTRGADPELPDGNPARGKALTESSKCLDCHRIGETGSRLGPDLSQVGTRRSRDLLYRALVAPDDEVLAEHRFVRVVTADGTIIVGKLLNQDAFTVQLMTSDELLKSYLKSNLREHAIQEKGLMPSYEGKLTPEQLADIVSYLATLKGAEK